MNPVGLLVAARPCSLGLRRRGWHGRHRYAGRRWAAAPWTSATAVPLSARYAPLLAWTGDRGARDRRWHSGSPCPSQRRAAGRCDDYVARRRGVRPATDAWRRSLADAPADLDRHVRTGRRRRRRSSSTRDRAPGGWPTTSTPTRGAGSPARTPPVDAPGRRCATGRLRRTTSRRVADALDLATAGVALAAGRPADRRASRTARRVRHRRRRRAERGRLTRRPRPTSRP